MKYAIVALISLFCVAVAADSQVSRPTERYYFIGDFDSGNPFGWDTETVSSTVRDWSSGVVFELERGVDVEIANIEIICSRGRVCDRLRGGQVVDGRPLFIRFRRDLDVTAIRVRAKPHGFSVPSPRVNVYLESSNGW